MKNSPFPILKKQENETCEFEESIVHMRQIKQVPKVALKPRIDVNRSPKHRYQWPHKMIYVFKNNRNNS